VRQEWASQLDLYPTILDLAGGHPTDAEGRTLVPLLQGEETEWRDAVFVEFNGVNNLATSMVTARQGALKYGWNCSCWDELYDLDEDPHEMRNLADDPARAGDLRHMRELVAAWMEETRYGGLGMYRQSRLGA
jgi:arylsulfatase A-like enzyme